jgi:hypothetical protein
MLCCADDRYYVGDTLVCSINNFGDRTSGLLSIRDMDLDFTASRAFAAIWRCSRRRN